VCSADASVSAAPSICPSVFLSNSACVHVTAAARCTAAAAATRDVAIVVVVVAQSALMSVSEKGVTAIATGAPVTSIASAIASAVPRTVSVIRGVILIAEGVTAVIVIIALIAVRIPIRTVSSHTQNTEIPCNPS
jgi:hypothetical protein